MNPLQADTLVHADTSELDAADLMADIQKLAEIDEPSLAFREGGVTHVIPLRGEHLLIGRSQTAQIRFDDATVSRRHAMVVVDAEGGVKVLDDRSLNGVFVNGERVQSRLLADRDELTVGRYRLRFLAGARRFTISDPHGLAAAQA